jgi:predicted DNA-binding ribbon-helix-helix protein
VARTPIKRSFSPAGRRTSIALEQEFWAALMHIAISRQQTLTALIAEADAQRPEGRPLASALRVFAQMFALQAVFSQPSAPAAPIDSS